MCYHMHVRINPKGSEAARLRQRKFQLLRQFDLPSDLLPGSLSLTHRRCGQPTCHCTSDPGHPIWYLTFMVKGKQRVEHIPRPWVAEVQQRVGGGRQFKDAVAELFALNAQLLALWRKQKGR